MVNPYAANVKESYSSEFNPLLPIFLSGGRGGGGGGSQDQIWGGAEPPKKFTFWTQKVDFF